MATTKTNAFYGFSTRTYYVSETGRFWLIQSAARVDGLPIEVDVLPDGGDWLDFGIDMDLVDTVREFKEVGSIQ